VNGVMFCSNENLFHIMNITINNLRVLTGKMFFLCHVSWSCSSYISNFGSVFALVFNLFCSEIRLLSLGF
jgi:hypothetical protein